MRDHSHLAEQVAEVPLAFAQRDRSTACLLRDAGFPELRDAVTADDIAAVLRREPDLEELWLERGGDQRLAGGWGLERAGDGYCLRHFSGSETRHFTDRTRAVAEFIVRYVGVVGAVLERTH